MPDFTADFCDDHPEVVAVLGPGYTNFGGAPMSQGKVVTIQLDRNNSDLISLLRDEPGDGRFVVVDSEQAYYAIVGEQLMKYAHSNGYAGILVNGYIRDTEQIKTIPVSLYALGTCPRKYIPVTKGQRDVPVSFGDVTFKSGDYVYTDTDGVIVSPQPLPSTA